jgi:hypothetical protein
VRLEIVAWVVLAVVVLAWIYRRDKSRVDAERKVLFDDARGLLADAEIERRPREYPKLRGRYRGHDVTIDAVIDTIAVRKLPSVWLRVTVMAEIPFAGACDVMARAHNVEFYSPFGDLDHGIALPSGWPDHLSVKTDDPGRMPPAALLGPHIAIFQDERMKELLVTPKGVRLVRQAAQGARAEYMVLRQAAFGPVVIPRAQLQTMLEAASTLAEALQAARPTADGGAAGGEAAAGGTADGVAA